MKVQNYAKAKTFIIIAFFAFYSLTNTQSAADDQVDISVPNYSHKFYSGYLTLSIIPYKRIHYVYFQSQNDVTKDPLLVWMTGGPGCSSLLGLFHQNGPFVFQAGKHNFQLNKFAWNNNANLLYLELPAGVGFSQTNSNSTQTDQTTVDEAINALRSFLSRFPKLKKNDLYLSGHGYAGVYITKVAKQMVDENNDQLVVFNDKWNLKGILAGNPCTKSDQCYASGAQKNSRYHYEFLFKRGYFPDVIYNQYIGVCLLNYNSFQCLTQRNKLDKQFNETNSSAYNIYSKCYKGQNDSISNLEYVNTGCQDDAGILTYLNDPVIQQSWNINPKKQWKTCNNTVFLNYLGGNGSYHLYPALIKNNIRIWIYSGDVDSYVPITGTRTWISQLRHQLQMPIRKIWRQWWVPGRHKGQAQVGGFIWQLQGLTFASVKAAGFRAGFDQPQAMFQVITGFLNGKTLPYNNV